MAGERPEVTEREITALLFRYGELETVYEASGALARRMVLYGRIRNSDKSFYDKGIRIGVRFPADPEWEQQIKDREEADSVCGIVRINANLEPKRIELYDEAAESEPVRASIAVSSEAFEAFCLQAQKASDRQRLLRARIKLVGKSLPKKFSELPPSLVAWDYSDLDGLDVSEDRDYAVASFTISDVRGVDRYRGRVLCMDGIHSTVDVSILLTEARWCIDSAQSQVRWIRCEGRLVRPFVQPYTKANASIEFENHEYSLITDELPERAYAGEFDYFPKPSNEDPASFRFRLRHVPGDISDFIFPTLSHGESTYIILSINLAIDREVLAATSKDVSGEVLSYDFEVSRRLLSSKEAS
jgi:hypothetical protein